MKKKSDNKSKKKSSLHNKEKKKGVGVNNNLIPIKPGEVRNPRGRPPNISSIPHNIREVGKELVTIKITTFNKKGEKEEKRVETTKAKAIVYRMYAMAIAGSDKAAKLLWERELGKPAQTVAIGLLEGEDVNVIFIGADFLVEDEEGLHGGLTDIEDAEFEEKDDDNGQIKGEEK